MLSGMGYRRTPFVEGEWYHCYNRGIDKRIVFNSPEDFERFVQLLYLANDSRHIDRENTRRMPLEAVLALPREEPLVTIGAWCLMNNHFHLLLQEKTKDGISKFLHKIGTGYTKYFNLKNERIGNLMVKPFRSKHVADDRYFRRVVSYIHLNPAELFERGWKKGAVKDPGLLKEKVLAYPYSSLGDYSVATPRIERVLLDTEAKLFIGDTMPHVKEMLADAAAYYAGLPKEFD
jgi:REP element-mobilizing transposase RayT